jgi:hypothetical protein
MTMRFTSGGSHFGFLLVELARFIFGCLGCRWIDRSAGRYYYGAFGAKLASNKGLLDPPCVITVFNRLFNDSPLGGLPDAGNLDYRG